MQPGRYAIWVGVFVAVLLLVSLGSPSRSDDAVTVFAAASLGDAMHRFVADYRRDTGQEIRLSLAASSTLARQIEAGAPADIFVSANKAWMDYLADRGDIDAEQVATPIGNRLVLVAESSVANDIAIHSIAEHLGDGRLAVGDPAHVPAGVYARQALTQLGLWERLEPRLARADNVRAALALVARREAPMAIVYATDSAMENGVVTVDTFADDSHDPIVYSFVLLNESTSVSARAVFATLVGETGVSVFEEHGFVRR